MARQSRGAEIDHFILQRTSARLHFEKRSAANLFARLRVHSRAFRLNGGDSLSSPRKKGAEQRCQEFSQHRNTEFNSQDAHKSNRGGIDECVEERKGYCEQKPVSLRLALGKEVTRQEKEGGPGNPRTPRRNPQSSLTVKFARVPRRDEEAIDQNHGNREENVQHQQQERDASSFGIVDRFQDRLQRGFQAILNATSLKFLTILAFPAVHSVRRSQRKVNLHQIGGRVAANLNLPIDL